MINDLSWTMLTLAPSCLLVVGACALAAWAARQRDAQSELVERLTGGSKEEC